MNWFTLDYALVVAIMLVGVLLLNDNNKIIAYVFSGITITSNVIGELIPNEYGSMYYLAAALADLAIIYALSNLSRPSELTIDVQDACRYFILVNLFGWAAFMLYIKPDVYNLLCAILYSWILLTMIRNKDDYVLGNNAMDRWWNGISANIVKGVGYMPRNEREARN